MGGMEGLQLPAPTAHSGCCVEVSPDPIEYHALLSLPPGADLAVINDCLDDLIQRAKSTRQEDDIEALQQRDYSQVGGGLLLRGQA